MDSLLTAQIISLPNLTFAFSNISSREVFDILVVSFAIYIVLLFIKQTKSYFVLLVSIILIGLGMFSQNLNLPLTRSILQPISTLTFVIIAIVFQREIRRFFRWIVFGKHHVFSKVKEISKNASAEIAEALLIMAEQKIGAIIVFSGKQDIEELIEGGQTINGEITKELILSIFDPGSPGHDGAIIIENNLIKQFGVHLPLARNYDGYRKAGTRHRAGTGITEDTDSIAFIVSEERGKISIAQNGKIKILEGEEKLRNKLKDFTGENESKNSNFWHYFLVSNLFTKILALVIATTLWFGIVAQSGITKKEIELPISFQLLPTTYEIDSQKNKLQATVTIMGKNTDINSFDSSKLDVKVDARDFKVGNQKIEITSSMINIPSFLSIAEIEPETFTINIKEKVIPNDNEQNQ
jgi:diadenylate cyclase